MKLLTGNSSLSVKDLARRLDTTYRSIYRYLDSFKEAGFAVRKVRPGVYELIAARENLPDLDRLVYFSDEEAAIVNALIEGLDNTNTLKRNLHQKLSAIYDVAPVTDFISKDSNALNVRELSDAIKLHKAALLHDFNSSSGSVRDRRIEPFAFTTNYIHVWGYDLEDGRCKMFGIARIGEVEVLRDDWRHEREHHRDETDIFRMSGKRQIRVRLELDAMSRDLLLEEYPLAAGELQDGKDGRSWILDTRVCALQGVGRFAIGLADHVKVTGSPELKRYMNDFILNNFSKRQ